jgi:hypothetical protein
MITVAGAALEKAAGMGSADDMSLDQSEPESESIYWTCIRRRRACTVFDLDTGGRE